MTRAALPLPFLLSRRFRIDSSQKIRICCQSVTKNRDAGEEGRARKQTPLVFSQEGVSISSLSSPASVSIWIGKKGRRR